MDAPRVAQLQSASATSSAEAAGSKGQPDLHSVPPGGPQAPFRTILDRHVHVRRHKRHQRQQGNEQSRWQHLGWPEQRFRRPEASKLTVCSRLIFHLASHLALCCPEAPTIEGYTSLSCRAASMCVGACRFRSPSPVWWDVRFPGQQVSAPLLHHLAAARPRSAAAEHLKDRLPQVGWRATPSSGPPPLVAASCSVCSRSVVRRPVARQERSRPPPLTAGREGRSAGALGAGVPPSASATPRRRRLPPASRPCWQTLEPLPLPPPGSSRP